MNNLFQNVKLCCKTFTNVGKPLKGNTAIDFTEGALTSKYVQIMNMIRVHCLKD